jgi:hypothetical protein
VEKLYVSPEEALHQAHVALLEELRDLEEAVRRTPGPGQGEMILRLEALGEIITDHFRFEEQDGYMSAVRQLEPHREHEVQQLQDEHSQLAEALDGLTREARAAETLHRSYWENLRAWVAQVRHHEAAENRLVQVTFNQDIGTKD